MQCRGSEGSEITVVQLRLAPLSFTHWNSSRFLESFNYVMHCWRWIIQISSYLSLRNIVFKHFQMWQTGDPRPIFAPKGLGLSWMLLLYQIIITITCWHHLFQITSLFNQFTSLLALNCSCPNFFWNVLQVWMTGKDVYLQMTWSWSDKTWNILCSYCLQWNTSQSKFRNHYFLFLFAFSILSQLFPIWGCTFNTIITIIILAIQKIKAHRHSLCFFYFSVYKIYDENRAGKELHVWYTDQSSGVVWYLYKLLLWILKSYFIP